MPAPNYGTALARERQALNLRIAHQYTFQQIADFPLPCPAHEPEGSPECGLCGTLYKSRSGAVRAVQRCIERDFPKVSDAERQKYIAEQQATISVLLAKAIEDALGSEEPVDRARATAVCVRLLTRQAHLLGLDARARGAGEDDLDASIRELVDELVRKDATG